MLYLLIRYRVQHDWVWSGSIALAAVSYFIFFAVQSHHEPRYILPTTVLLILLSGIFFALLNKRKWPGGIFFRNVVLGLLCFQLLFHAVHIGRMLYLYLDGPAEQQMLERLLSILTDTEGAVSVLALRDNLLAHPHTHESYDAYAKLYGFADRGLFTTLQTTAIYPRDTYLLDVTYFSYFHLPPEQAPHMGNYEIIISRHRPNEPDVPNNRDPGGVNIMRYWYPDILQEQYVLYFHSARLQQQYGTYEDTF